MGTFGYLLSRDSTAPVVLVNAVVVCIAFFFGTHGIAPAAPVPAAGAAVPRRARIIRGLLVLGFAGLAVWFLRSGFSLGSFPPELLEIWEVLGGYLLGIAVSWAFHHRAHETPTRHRLALLFRDVSAAGALGLTLFACYAFVVGVSGMVGTGVEQGLSLIITYYFGSRVIAR